MSRKVINNIFQNKEKINEFVLTALDGLDTNLNNKVSYNFDGLQNFDPTADVNVATFDGKRLEFRKVYGYSQEGFTIKVFSAYVLESWLLFSVVLVYSDENPTNYELESFAKTTLLVP